VDDELKDVIEKERFDTVDPQIVEQLLTLGVVSESQQLQRFTALYQQRVHAPFEYEFTILPTYHCNLTCYYCTPSEKTLSHDLLQKVKEFFSKEVEKGDFENVAVRIAGGEPLLHPGLLFEMLEELSRITEEHGKKFFSGLATNGTLLTSELLDTLSFLDAVQLTFEGCRSYHDSVRYDKTGTFDRVLRSAEMIRDAGIFLNMRVHVSEKSINGLEELFDVLRSSVGVGVTSKTMITAAPVVTTRICPLYPSRCTEAFEAVDLMQKAWEAAKKCGILITGMPSPPYERLPCPYVTPTSLIVDPDGTFYTCLMGATEGIRAAGSVEEGFHPEPVQESGELWQEECELCQLLPLCGGGCAWRHQEHTDAACKIKELLKERLKFSLRTQHPILE
jgi:uncharacterized protein